MQGKTVTQDLARGIGRVVHAKTYDRIVAVMKLCECRIGHVLTVAVRGISRHQGNRRLGVRSPPVLTGG